MGIRGSSSLPLFLFQLQVLGSWSMQPLALHEVHSALGATFGGERGFEVVADYGDSHGEHAALWQSAGVIDLSFRGRLCLTGAYRVRLLNG